MPAGPAPAHSLTTARRSTQGPDRRHCGGGSLVPLVLPPSPGARPARSPVASLSHVSTPKPIGVAVRTPDLGDAQGRGLADVLEVRCAATDHDAEGNECVVSRVRGPQHATDSSKVPGTRTLVDLGDTGVGQPTTGAVEQPTHHLLVPARGDDRDPQAAAVDRRWLGAPLLSCVSSFRLTRTWRQRARAGRDRSRSRLVTR